jgi:hypothetical protein
MNETVKALVPVVLFISFLIVPAFAILIIRDKLESKRTGKPVVTRPRLDLTDVINALKVNPIFYFYVGGTAYFFEKDEAGLILILVGVILTIYRVVIFLQKKLRNLS